MCHFRRSSSTLALHSIKAGGENDRRQRQVLSHTPTFPRNQGNKNNANGMCKRKRTQTATRTSEKSANLNDSAAR